MDFALIKYDEICENRYPPLVPEAIGNYKIVRTYAVTGDNVFTQLVGFQKRRRRFLIERLEIAWTRKDGEDYRRLWVTATGPALLSNGEVSTRSTGFESWRPGDEMPADIAKLAAQEDKRYICMSA